MQKKPAGFEQRLAKGPDGTRGFRSCGRGSALPTPKLCFGGPMVNLQPSAQSRGGLLGNATTDGTTGSQFVSPQLSFAQVAMKASPALSALKGQSDSSQSSPVTELQINNIVPALELTPSTSAIACDQGRIAKERVLAAEEAVKKQKVLEHAARAQALNPSASVGQKVISGKTSHEHRGPNGTPMAPALDSTIKDKDNVFATIRLPTSNAGSFLAESSHPDFNLSGDSSKGNLGQRNGSNDYLDDSKQSSPHSNFAKVDALNIPTQNQFTSEHHNDSSFMQAMSQENPYGSLGIPNQDQITVEERERARKLVEDFLKSRQQQDGNIHHSHGVATSQQFPSWNPFLAPNVAGQAHVNNTMQPDLFDLANQKEEDTDEVFCFDRWRVSAVTAHQQPEEMMSSWRIPDLSDPSTAWQQQNGTARPHHATLQEDCSGFEDIRRFSAFPSANLAPASHNGDIHRSIPSFGVLPQFDYDPSASWMGSKPLFLPAQRAPQAADFVGTASAMDKLQTSFLKGMRLGDVERPSDMHVHDHSHGRLEGESFDAPPGASERPLAAADTLKMMLGINRAQAEMPSGVPPAATSGVPPAAPEAANKRLPVWGKPDGMIDISLDPAIAQISKSVPLNDESGTDSVKGGKAGSAKPSNSSNMSPSKSKEQTKNGIKSSKAAEDKERAQSETTKSPKAKADAKKGKSASGSKQPPGEASSEGLLPPHMPTQDQIDVVPLRGSVECAEQDTAAQRVSALFSGNYIVAQPGSMPNWPGQSGMFGASPPIQLPSMGMHLGNGGQPMAWNSGHSDTGSRQGAHNGACAEENFADRQLPWFRQLGLAPSADSTAVGDRGSGPRDRVEQVPSLIHGIHSGHVHKGTQDLPAKDASYGAGNGSNNQDLRRGTSISVGGGNGDGGGGSFDFSKVFGGAALPREIQAPPPISLGCKMLSLADIEGRQFTGQ